MKYIALLDCNNFFVSCERLFRPDLLGKPVVVLSSNDGCVVARSKEIKDRGIGMGVPYFQIKDTLNEIGATVFSSHFALYRDVSRRVFEVVRTSQSEIEQYSIDECFFTFESDDPLSLVAAIKQQVEQEVGIPVSIGVASSKTQAKYVNTVAKKTTGIAIWGEEEWVRAAADIRLSEIWGVGRGRARQFDEKGIKTVADLLKCSRSRIDALFGIEGIRLQAELGGEAVLGIKASRPLQKSLMSTRSFAKETSNYDVLLNAIKYHLYQVVQDLESMDAKTNVIRVMITPSRYGDYAFYGASKEALLTAPTRDLFALQQAAVGLLKQCFNPEVPYKKAGVVLSGISSTEAETGSLFDNLESAENNGKNSLSATIFSINKKHGKPLVQLGSVSGTNKKWESRKDAVSPSYTTSWSDLKVVRT